MEYKLRIRVETIKPQENKDFLDGPFNTKVAGKYDVSNSVELKEDQVDLWGDEISNATTFKTFLDKPKSLDDVIENFNEIDTWLNQGSLANTKLFSNKIFSSFFSVYPERLIQKTYTFPLNQIIFKKLLNVLDAKGINYESIIDDTLGLSHTFLKEFARRGFVFHQVYFYDQKFSSIDSYRFRIFWKVLNHSVNLSRINHIIEELSQMLQDNRIQDLVFLISSMNRIELTELLGKVDIQKHGGLHKIINDAFEKYKRF
jgi:hypothetical protein